MLKITEYVVALILDGCDDEDVKRFLKEGYQPYGSPCCAISSTFLDPKEKGTVQYVNCMYQAFVKYEEEVKS